MKQNIIIIFFLFLSINLYAYNTNNVKCDITKLNDKNNKDIIICKYIQKRVNFDKTIFIEWINPIDRVERARKLKIPAGHGSVYDYRYLAGRAKGIWKFVVTDNNQTYQTTFEVK